MYQKEYSIKLHFKQGPASGALCAKVEGTLETELGPMKHKKGGVSEVEF